MELKIFSSSHIMLPILILSFIILRVSNAMITINYTQFDCSNSPTSTPNSSFKTNLNLLLSTLVSKIDTSKNGFYNFTSNPRSPDPAYGLVLCRGDVVPDECQNCVAMAIKQLLEVCPSVKEATIWKEECMLRYSYKSIFSLLEENPHIMLQNVNNATDLERWTTLLGDVLSNITSKAASEESGKKFATKEARFSSLQTLYSLAQCTPDLTVEDCNRCFSLATAYLPTMRQGGIVLVPSCSVRYEVYPFYQNFSLPQLPSPTLAPPPMNITIGTKSTGKKKVSVTKVVIAITVPLFILGLLIGIAIWLFRRKANNYQSPNNKNALDDFTTVESLVFQLSTLEAATNNFSDDNKLGEGGFGGVYKGTLPNGQEIAVKRLSRSSGQGAEEFKNEVVLVAKLQHRNLARLMGFCLAGKEKLLVYEFVPNKSLNYFLFDPEKQGQLNWLTRYNIIRGIARGMLYLHEDSRLKIIHRDLKASNILLDAAMNPKISDFGMARIFNLEQTQENTGRVVGTYGYMAPEYVMHGQYSVKSDVYSFGVLVLEIVSGKKISEFHQSGNGEDLLSHAWRCWRDGSPLEFMDPTLRDSYSGDEVIRCIHLGLSSVQEDINERPTMATIVLMLNTYSATGALAMPQRPAFFYSSNTESQRVIRSDGPYSLTTTSSSNSAPVTMNQVTISEMDPR